MTCFHFLLQPGNSLEILFSGPRAQCQKPASGLAKGTGALPGRGGARGTGSKPWDLLSSPLYKPMQTFADYF